ncbi:hypothetical protein Spiaf_2673 [Spirochaeta africana DSM 8902]|uniref:Organic solvent tolerance-like N-terminal domain-containing protein n=2 Tax=Spirochaeta TaxID=146 RepID=H9UMF6_SPIAZ|nr:hypothetical protein Spiaf_2673 [Spirochaeta africana DSM 8902]
MQGFRPRGHLYRMQLLILLLLLAAGTLGAEQRSRSFTFSSDRSSTVLREGRERTRLEGNARIQTEDIVITANVIEVYGESFRFAEASGNLRVVDESRGIELTARQFFYDRELDVSRAVGAVYMEDTINEVVVRGGFLESLGEEDVILVQVNVRIFREDMTARAEFARFLRVEDILELSGLPVVFMNGDEYRASRIQLDLENDEILLQGSVQGTVSPRQQGGEE